MRFGLLYELQLPRPWDDRSEHRLIHEALAEVEIADQLGFDYLWANEHHFLEEYSHSSAPEVFLAAAAARTQRIHVGHAVVLSPPGYNPPARVAERIATLDLVSRGRVEWGTGESASLAELGGFNVPVGEKRPMWLEAVEQCANMMTMDPYPGFTGKYFSMPCRNIVPKPVQRPHPPLWVACSNRETIRLAARLGIGALTFAFVDPAEAKMWVDEYYRTLKEECTPIGHAVNAQIAMVTGFSLHPDQQEALRRGLDGFRFFSFGLEHYYASGSHKPGRSDLWAQFESSQLPVRDTFKRGLGTPDDMRAHLKGFADAGVDQVVFIQQGGRNRHEHICEALDLFSRAVMPEFKAAEETRRKRKAEDLAPFIEQAMRRKVYLDPIADAHIPEIVALGRSVAAQRG